MKALLIVILIIVLAVVVFVFFDREGQEVVVPVATETPTPTAIPETTEAVRKQGELNDVSGGSSSGMALTLYEDGKFTHSVIALMPDAPVGKFYEGWLVKKEDDKVVNFFSTGKMTKEGGAYILSFEDSQNYPEHNNVVITLEEVEDEKPEVHILEGTLTVVQ